MAILKKTPDDNREIEEAIKFLVSSVKKYSRNPKPVLTHCFKVAFYLDYLGCSRDVVIAALLHDLLEDTSIKPSAIEKKFGKKIFNLVKSCTFDEKIKNKTERYKRNFERAKKAGKEALIIRAADLWANSDYYHLAGNEDLFNWLIEKLDYFLVISEESIGEERIYEDLLEKRKSLK